MTEQGYECLEPPHRAALSLTAKLRSATRASRSWPSSSNLSTGEICPEGRVEARQGGGDEGAEPSSPPPFFRGRPGGGSFH